MTLAGSLDCLGSPAGTDGFRDIDAVATDEDPEGFAVRVASLDDLIRMKRVPARPQDRVPLEWLGAPREEFDNVHVAARTFPSQLLYSPA
jgi:hypothetical protein